MPHLSNRLVGPSSAVPARRIAAAVLACSCIGTALADTTDTPIPPPVDTPYPGTIAINVDATNTAQRIFTVHEAMPVQAGALTLLYPKWLPGSHSPSGPIDKLASLKIRVAGKPLAWERNKYDVYAFHVDVPAGVSGIDLDYQFLSPQQGRQGRIVMTPEMLNLQWNTVILYPAGHYSRAITFLPSVKLPTGWQFGTALEAAAPPDGTLSAGMTTFKPVTLNTLIDSPIYAGEYFKRVDLDPGAKTAVRMDIVADAPEDLEIAPAQLNAHRALVQQAYKLYGSHHYDHYDFLFSLSDQMGGNGLEHHQSSENGTDREYFSDWDKDASGRDLLAHEYTHSWNGKFRRPADLWTPNFNVPMGDSLLWVYEGQTQYWGFVLTARAGMWSPQQFRDGLALVAATYQDNRPGFDWRNVQDTTNDPSIAQRRPQPYRNYQMREEYYSAGQLIWLAVDARLRELSHDRHSLDDFARTFFGADNGSFVTSTYTFDDVVAALNGIEKHDWATFLRSRLDAHAPPMDGLAASGWKLVYTDKPSDYEKAEQKSRKSADFAYSLGVTLASADGEISDVRWNGPAFKAGIAPGGTLVAVDGHAFKPEVLNEAIVAAKTNRAPIELLLKYQDEYKTVPVDYHDGPRHPHLESIAGAPDYLSRIAAARK
ncbi:MAG: peptidase M61 [Rudaea sp.]|nr:peptidase M61 [Rudaea sp.]